MVEKRILAFAMVAALAACGGSAPGEVEFDEATSHILASAQAATSGNSAEAEKLAERFNGAFQEKLAGNKEAPHVAAEDRPVTFCQLREDRVCFLVRLRGLRGYKGEARAALIGAAWSSATAVTRDLRKKKDRKVGVALRGPFAYGGVAVGMGKEEPQVQQGFRAPVAALYEFFATEGSQERPPAPPGGIPATGGPPPIAPAGEGSPEPFPASPSAPEPPPPAIEPPVASPSPAADDEG